MNLKLQESDSGKKEAVDLDSSFESSDNSDIEVSISFITWSDYNCKLF